MAYVKLGAITPDVKPAQGWVTVRLRVTQPFDEEGSWLLTAADKVGEDV